MVTKEFIRLHTSHISSSFRKKDASLTREDIQDLVQDTFEKVTLYQDYYEDDYDKNRLIPPEKRLRSWLKLVAVQVYDRHRRGVLQMEEVVSDYSKDDLLESHNDYYYNNNKEEVDQLINMLPNQQKDIVYLKLVLGHTHDEISTKLVISSTNSRTLYSKGLSNLKNLINSDNPEHEIMYEAKILKPHGDKPYAGDWAWRYGESKEQRNGKCYTYTKEEIIAYCNERKLNYNL